MIPLPVVRFAAIEGLVLEAAAMLLVFVGVLFLGSMLLPGHRVAGPNLEGKSRAYKLNGLALFLIVVMVVCLAQVFGWFSLSVLHTHFAALFVAANGFAFALSGWLYYRGARARDASPGVWRGFFFGLELNPTWLGVDLKLFSYRPSLIALALFNASFAVVQYETYGGLTLAMALYQIFTFLYVLNYFQFEYGMIHTWDMVSERFGWMLIWGRLCVGAVFSIALRAGGCSTHRNRCLPLPPPRSSCCSPLASGSSAAPTSKSTASSVTLRSRFGDNPPGRWTGACWSPDFGGIGRHLNYTGEICVYLAFTLTTGLASWVPYLLPAWLGGLLWHRSRRDERRCRAKYGELWGRYTQRVRYSMLPFVY